MFYTPNIKPQEVDFYSPDGEYIGHLNQYEANDLLIYIMKNKIKGCYAYFEGNKIAINDQGRYQSRPEGMFDLFTNQLIELIGF